VLVDAQHATGTPPKLRWNIGCELDLNYRGDNVRLLIYVLCREIPRPAVQPNCLSGLLQATYTSQWYHGEFLTCDVTEQLYIDATPYGKPLYCFIHNNDYVGLHNHEFKFMV